MLWAYQTFCEGREVEGIAGPQDLSSCCPMQLARSLPPAPAGSPLHRAYPRMTGGGPSFPALASHALLCFPTSSCMSAIQVCLFSLRADHSPSMSLCAGDQYSQQVGVGLASGPSTRHVATRAGKVTDSHVELHVP